jgi:hypothetical protein
MLVETSLAVANTGATLLFLTKGAPCQNKRCAVNPFFITLPHGSKIKSTHVCDVMILGLPMILTGYIMPDMTTASLFGIRVLWKAGCQVLFDDNKSKVIFNGTVILTGYKDIASNLWTLPIHPSGMPQTALDALHQSPLGPCLSDASRHTANFSYHHTRKENNVKVMHQSLCNPPKLSLLAAIRQEFLHGAPHLSKKVVTKYLPPSPVTCKGHMKQPPKGLQSTTPKQPRIGVPASVPDPVMPGLINPLDYNKDDNFSKGNPHFNIINDVDNHPNANIFCFGTFANKITGVIYNDCTGKFPFMSLDGNIFLS